MDETDLDGSTQIESVHIRRIRVPIDHRLSKKQ